MLLSRVNNGCVGLTNQKQEASCPTTHQMPKLSKTGTLTVIMYFERKFVIRIVVMRAVKRV